MAESHRMTAEEVVAELISDEHADFVRESLRWMVEQLMETEVLGLIGAERGERTPDRATHRNGYRPRRWDTRAGEIELQIPKLRQGSYFPGFLKPRKRSEQALVSVVQQAYVCGVSTRRVDQLVESLGLRVSRSEVSRISAGLDDQVEAFRQRPLEGRYPYLFVDAKVEKVRAGGRVVRKCVVIAHAVHETGRREIIGFDVGAAETEAFPPSLLVLASEAIYGSPAVPVGRGERGLRAHAALRLRFWVLDDRNRASDPAGVSVIAAVAAGAVAPGLIWAKDGGAGGRWISERAWRSSKRSRRG